MQKTKMARIEGPIYKFFEKTAKTHLLILDDFGLVHLEKQQQLDLMELITTLPQPARRSVVNQHNKTPSSA